MWIALFGNLERRMDPAMDTRLKLVTEGGAVDGQRSRCGVSKASDIVWQQYASAAQREGKGRAGQGRVVMDTEVGSGGLAVDKAGSEGWAGCAAKQAGAGGSSLPWDARETRPRLVIRRPKARRVALLQHASLHANDWLSLQ